MSRTAHAPPRSGGGLWTALALLGATVLVVVLGAMLRAEPERPEPAAGAGVPPPRDVASPAGEPAAAPPPAASLPGREVRETVEAEPAPSPAPPHAGSTLEARLQADAGRLSATGARYTRQLMVACQRESVDRLLGQTRDPRLYVLPTLYQGRPCYRVCWGAYGNREAAQAGSDMPSWLRRLFPDAQPRPLETVLP